MLTHGRGEVLRVERPRRQHGLHPHRRLVVQQPRGKWPSASRRVCGDVRLHRETLRPAGAELRLGLERGRPYLVGMPWLPRRGRVGRRHVQDALPRERGRRGPRGHPRRYVVPVQAVHGFTLTPYSLSLCSTISAPSLPNFNHHFSFPARLFLGCLFRNHDFSCGEKHGYGAHVRRIDRLSERNWICGRGTGLRTIHTYQLPSTTIAVHHERGII